MITVEAALQSIEDNVKSIPHTELKSVPDALHYMLSKDVISPMNMPPFRQSAMDGYAVRLHDNDTYKVIDEVKAGDNKQPELEKGDAVRIFTGAPVPETANAIIIQEHVTKIENSILTNKAILLGANIRPLGEQIIEGEIALKKGTKLTPAAIGFLTTLGITYVNVLSKPDICIVVTGNELISPGEELLFGQIYESNAVMLSSELLRLGYDKVTVKKVGDNYSRTLHVLNSAIQDHDLVLISGGISVGDYDYVREALTELNVEQLFYKVRQKPGKPLFFGKMDDTVLFALPGNPASALSCFYIYVYKALHLLVGDSQNALPRIQAKSVSNFVRKGDRPQFLKAIFNQGNVEILDGQNSSMLHTFSLANAMVYVPLTMEEIKEGDLVEIVLLPTN